MHTYLPLIARQPCLILWAAFLTGTIMLAGCGSQPAQPFQNTAALPPAIPAAEPILLFNGTGTSSDVGAVQAVLGALHVGHTTADSAQLNSMSEQQLAGYKLIIVPGGNSIDIGHSLTANAVANLRGAVQQYGVHYLGLCAGAFFGAYSIYNGANLTDGTSFDFYADELKGIHEELVQLSFPNRGPLNVYWQDGPQLTGWGHVVAKFPDGTPAIVEGQSGSGFVIFTGVHPEAPASWLDPMTSTAAINADQAYAATVIQAALDGAPLPHF
jgi:Biotin-protein ligase, N terminal